MEFLCVTVLNFFGIHNTWFRFTLVNRIFRSELCSTPTLTGMGVIDILRMYRKSKRVLLHSVMKLFKPVALMQIQRLSEQNNKKKHKNSCILVNNYDNTSKTICYSSWTPLKSHLLLWILEHETACRLGDVL